MIMDSLLLFSNAQDLTVLTAATAAPSTNTIDFSQARDFGNTEHFRVFAMFGTLPASATAGATLTVDVQISTDAATWETLESFPAIPIAELTQLEPFLVRAKPAVSNAPYRYMRLQYTASAVLTAGAITAGINLDNPYRHAYPRNYVA